ncbi:MAG: hypothetical protein M1821_008639 [Bathelium mastoideum]|nr:MAG: hypothetical protein M1821_008639 [Bathelium mastoideum]KAI9687235.1 MAG: hypothetical protein M1822_002278 [Bathelium mastoideum]
MDVPVEGITYSKSRSMLLEIKILYWKRQYKQCAHYCGQLLRLSNEADPLYETYLNFYSAISYENVARAIHNHAVNKVPTLELAEDYFAAALQSLASCDIFGDEPAQITMSHGYIHEALPHGNCRHILYQPGDQDGRPVSASSASSVTPPSDGTAATRPSSASSLSSTPYGLSKFPARSSFATQYVSRLNAPKASTTQNRRAPSPRPLELASSCTAIRATEDQQMDPILTSPTSPNSTDAWLLSRSKAKYNAHLSAFHAQLEYHIRIVQALKASAVKSQQKRRLSSAPASYWVLPIGKMNDEEKEKRIQEGRARQWERKSRFGDGEAERIKALCEQAIREL